jgi:hypothetical protein
LAALGAAAFGTAFLTTFLAGAVAERRFAAAARNCFAFAVTLFAPAGFFFNFCFPDDFGAPALRWAFALVFAISW